MRIPSILLAVVPTMSRRGLPHPIKGVEKLDELKKGRRVISAPAEKFATWNTDFSKCMPRVGIESCDDVCTHQKLLESFETFG